MTVSVEKIQKATEVVARYTLMAAGTGTAPVPSASVAVVAENGIMIAHVADVLSVESITVGMVVRSMGIAASLNLLGRTVFIEGAKLLSWGTGSFWAAVGLSALGATTAGIQTYIIGSLAIEIGKNDGKCLKAGVGKRVIEEAREQYDDFISYWKSKKADLRA